MLSSMLTDVQVSSPWSYSCKKTPKDAEDQLEAALGATAAIKNAHGTTFTAGDLCSMTYKYVLASVSYEADVRRCAQGGR